MLTNRINASATIIETASRARKNVIGRKILQRKENE